MAASLTVERRGSAVFCSIPPLLTLEVVQELARVATREAYGGDPDYAYPRVMVVTGKGRDYSLGVDLREAQHQVQKWLVEGQAALDELWRISHCSPMSIVHVVRGKCFGGGFELALTGSRMLVAEDASIALSEARFGLIPGWGGPWRLLHLAGSLQKALWMLITGEGLQGADKIRELDLVDLFMDPAASIEEVQRLVLAAICPGCQYQSTTSRFRKDRGQSVAVKGYHPDLDKEMVEKYVHGIKLFRDASPELQCLWRRAIFGGNTESREGFLGACSLLESSARLDKVMRLWEKRVASEIAA